MFARLPFLLLAVGILLADCTSIRATEFVVGDKTSTGNQFVVSDPRGRTPHAYPDPSVPVSRRPTVPEAPGGKSQQHAAATLSPLPAAQIDDDADPKEESLDIPQWEGTIVGDLPGEGWPAGFPTADPCCGNACHGDFLGGCGGLGQLLASQLFLDLWLAQGFTWNPEDPANNFNLPVTFNDRANEYEMNQLYLGLGREVVKTPDGWDLGGRVDLLYGTDYFFTEAFGLEKRVDGLPHWNGSGPRAGGTAALYGLAMPQLYAQLYAPFLGGLDVKLGHFYTTLGYEGVRAPENFFYSHAYSFQYGQPFTHTGVLTQLTVAPQLNLHFAYTRGWNNWEDFNGKPGYLAGATWCPTSLASLAFALATGSEDPTGEHNRTVYTLTYTRLVSERLTYVLQHTFGSEPGAAINFNFEEDTAKWYGIVQYLYWQLCESATLGMRVEWFRDQENARVLGVPVQSLVSGSNYTEVSLGLNWKPSCRLLVRPEVRYDGSDVVPFGLGGEGMYDDFSDEDQVTLATDVIFRF
jgi:hypothetical protein